MILRKKNDYILANNFLFKRDYRWTGKYQGQLAFNGISSRMLDMQKIAEDSFELSLPGRKYF